MHCRDCALLHGSRYGSLVANNCMSQMVCPSSPSCQTNWQIVSAHHDHCSPTDLPSIIEVGFHDFESACGEACEIGRQYNPTLSACPNVTCSNNATLASAISALDSAGCASTCTSSVCVSNYRMLRAYHDTCEEHPNLSGLDQIHTFEDACEAAECNTVESVFNPNTCDGHTHPTSDTAAASSSDSTNTGLVIGLVIACVVAVLAIASSCFMYHRGNANKQPIRTDTFFNAVHTTALE